MLPLSLKTHGPQDRNFLQEISTRFTDQFFKGITCTQKQLFSRLSNMYLLSDYSYHIHLTWIWLFWRKNMWKPRETQTIPQHPLVMSSHSANEKQKKPKKNSLLRQHATCHNYTPNSPLSHRAPRTFALLHRAPRTSTLLHRALRTFTLLHRATRTSTLLHRAPRTFTPEHSPCYTGRRAHSPCYTGRRAHSPWTFTLLHRAPRTFTLLHRATRKKRNSNTAGVRLWNQHSPMHGCHKSDTTARIVLPLPCLPATVLVVVPIGKAWSQAQKLQAK